MINPFPILPFEPQNVSAVPIEVKPLEPTDPSRMMPRHGHLFFELVVITGQEGLITIDDTKYVARPGSAFAIPPGLPHDMSALRSATGWTVLFLPTRPGGTIGASSALSLLDDVPPGMTFDAFRKFGAIGTPLLLNPDSLAETERLFKKMQSELRNCAHGYEIAVQATLELILVEVGRGTPLARERSPRPTTASEAELIRRVFADIDAHFNARSSLSVAARRLGVSAGHLTTRLRYLTGRTYGEWVVEKRMMEARYRLANSNQSLSEIADYLGYANLESFIRRFRNRNAIPPGRWRAKTRQGAINQRVS